MTNASLILAAAITLLIAPCAAGERPATTAALGAACQGPDCKPLSNGKTPQKIGTVPTARPLYHKPPPGDDTPVDWQNTAGQQ